jgi:hypothetical protein
METNVCGVLFKKVDDETIAIYQDEVFYKNINYPAKTEQELKDSANFYFVHCY